MTTAGRDRLLAQTKGNQAAAADPLASVWVSANAGTGKTHVLTMRVMRLLLAGTAPERILCLTYTKAAAAEMSKRVFDRLAEWVICSEEELRKLLQELLERPPTNQEMVCARQLFAQAIETPGGFKVQTIHAFCERLLQRFPLEAGVPPHFSILDEDMAASLQREAIDDMLSTAMGARSGPLHKALMTAIAYAAEDHFDALLSDALRNRGWLEFLVRRNLEDPDALVDDADLSEAEADYRRIFGLSENTSTSATQSALSNVLSNDMAEAVGEVLAAGSKSDVSAAAKISDVVAADAEEQRIELLSGLFLTNSKERRKRLMTKKLSEAHPATAEQLVRAQDRFIALYDDLLKLKLLDATMAMLRLGSAVMQRYRQAKARRAALDYEDLLMSASNLLGLSASAEWVLFKLDGGLDHILVDEAQDTSRVQWRIIRALAQEFFAGSGAREEVRTLFAVGDEKQSIYSFQGAEPKRFAQMGAAFADLAGAGGQTWRRIPLTLSFRSVAPVLESVDRVFADPSHVPGLSAGEEEIRHHAHRIGQAGLVELWPTETYDDTPDSEIWSPLTDAIAAAPVARLAERIADTILGWLNNGEILQSQNRPVRAGDIIILLRKRRPFADHIVKALKVRGIAVAGADRMKLTEQVAVQDLMALGDFLSLPEDDLSLATVLKSPLFGLDDDHLLTLVRSGRNKVKGTGEGANAGTKVDTNEGTNEGSGEKIKGGPLWSALLALAKTDLVFVEAAEQLKRWRSQADYMPPYEFYASLLDRDGCRARLLARLGPEASDPIDEFLNLALTYDDGAPPSLCGFLDWLRSYDNEIKRDMEQGRDEVRVMTVHGAKGLEAPIVFLPDTCTTQSGGMPGSLLDVGDTAPAAGDDTPAPMVWPVKGTSKLATIRDAREALAIGDSEERHRLLYVAMTRARDRLYVAGFEGKKGRVAGCWYDLIWDGLGEVLQEHKLVNGSSVWRYEARQQASHETPKEGISEAVDALPPPAWAFEPAPREPTLSMPLAPSRLAPLESDDGLELDDMGEPVDSEELIAAELERARAAGPSALSPAALSDNHRFLRGTLSHALLEYLPQLDPAHWDSAATAFVASRGRALTRRTRNSIVNEVLAVLRAAEFSPLFGPDSQAEVPIAAEIPSPDGKGPVLKVTGQIDRLALIGEDVLIVDYKTNRPPPHDPDKVADAYLLQLAAYRLAVREAFAGKTVRAAILWTDGVRIMEISEPVLDQFEQRLWHLDRKLA